MALILSLCIFLNDCFIHSPKTSITYSPNLFSAHNLALSLGNVMYREENFYQIYYLPPLLPYTLPFFLRFGGVGPPPTKARCFPFHAEVFPIPTQRPFSGSYPFLSLIIRFSFLLGHYISKHYFFLS